ncbi:MAG: hypothetical protein J6K04_08085 [Lachnospiraceae bacterium]|nr:hypothetical protein [Lachnospiraceae bacterium]MBP3569110.1 hypothetical protein [Lachnospiraceae bacterium]
MDFSYYLKHQIELHPSMQMQDVIKMCYQAVFGVEHMLSDKEKAKQYFFTEYESTPANASIPLYEPISETFCRINLAAWKARALDPEELFELFVASANYSVPGTRTDLNNCAKSAEKLIAKGILPFTLEEWKPYYVAYKNDGMYPVHHSDIYRQAERPAYRLVRKSLLHADIS